MTPLIMTYLFIHDYVNSFSVWNYFILKLMTEYYLLLTQPLFA